MSFFFVSLGHVVSSVLNLCVESDISQLFAYLLGELFPILSNINGLMHCEVILDRQSVVAHVKVYYVLLTLVCCVLYHVS